MNLPTVDKNELQKTVSEVELRKGILPSLDDLALAVIKTSWAQENDLTMAEVKGLILHHQIVTKILTPVSTPTKAPEPVAQVNTPAPVQTGSSTVAEKNVYSQPGKGRKQCPICEKYVGVRNTVCVCGEPFKEKVKSIAPARPIAPVKPIISVPTSAPIIAAPIAESSFEEDERPCRTRGRGSISIYAPSGDCPEKLRGTDLEEVERWAEKVRDHYDEQNQFLTIHGLIYFVRHFYNMFTDDNKLVTQHLKDIYQNELQVRVIAF